MPDYRTQLPWKQSYRHKQVNREAKLGNEFIRNCKLFQAAIKIYNVQYMRMYPSSSRASSRNTFTSVIRALADPGIVHGSRLLAYLSGPE